jgi:hypothetical protein
MNDLLNYYCVSVEFPQTSGAEHLEMLQMRDRVAEIESLLTDEEKRLLANADRKLIANATQFYQELSRFINLAERRQNEKITPEYWWWYLDVLTFLPISLNQDSLIKDIEYSQ